VLLQITIVTLPEERSDPRLVADLKCGSGGEILQPFGRVMQDFCDHEDTRESDKAQDSGEVTLQIETRNARKCPILCK
jgi:hypothetical protein